MIIQRIPQGDLDKAEERAAVHEKKAAEFEQRAEDAERKLRSGSNDAKDEKVHTYCCIVYVFSVAHDKGCGVVGGQECMLMCVFAPN
jgi:hypothetical protein